MAAHGSTWQLGNLAAAASPKVYAVQLQPMYDYEFFGDANPLRPEEVLSDAESQKIQRLIGS